MKSVVRKISKRLISEDLRSELYVKCLNREFDDLLGRFKKIPVKEMDYSLLKLYLSRSCQWGHFPSVQYIWYKYVMRTQSLIVEPHLLCEISSLAVAEKQSFMPQQIYKHYQKYFSKKKGTLHTIGNPSVEYELLRANVESFADTSKENTPFSQKWSMFIREMDNYLPAEINFQVRDFPRLTNSVSSVTLDVINELLFTKGNIDIHNNTTLPLLLNMVLLQPEEAISNNTKYDLFKHFSETYPNLNNNDSITILQKYCKNDIYTLNKIKEYIPPHPEQTKQNHSAN